ncbi:MAG: amidohydrolase [Nitrospirae bacterium]|nr:amidohydrolase [Magnetococcales bacterium]HAT51177.1 amidohydrolase [Alphaproteobacteria bacterium]
MNRLRRLLLASIGVLGTTLAGCKTGLGVLNPCHRQLPESLAQHSLVNDAWEGIDAHHFWDCHVHLAGTGDSGSGITLAPEMNSFFHPQQYLQRLFYLNAGCVQDTPGRIDTSYVERLLQLIADMPSGVKMMLMAFDWAHDESGRPLPEHSAFFVPNEYTRTLAQRHPDHFEWIASIHPYRRDAVAAVERAHAHGARAIKWLPPAMNIDPDANQCQPFYTALARLNLPLLTHGGEEKAVHGIGKPDFGNPLKLRRALDTGVRVIMAHCASLGEDIDTDHGHRRTTSFELFGRMMEHPAHRDHLFADISAVTLRNRDPVVVRTLIERNDWHPRLLNGTDYPLPGIIPLIVPAHFVRWGLLAEDKLSVLRQLQAYNPLLFDFVLKRNLSWNNQRLPTSLFETRPFFFSGPEKS